VLSESRAPEATIVVVRIWLKAQESRVKTSLGHDGIHRRLVSPSCRTGETAAEHCLGAHYRSPSYI
jgi:hypothetical protein